MDIHVCPLPGLDRTMKDSGASHLLSVMGPQDMIAPWPGLLPERHLQVEVNDIIDPLNGFVLGREEHVKQIVDFTLDWAEIHQRAALVIHCWAGISRSTAAAFIALCALNRDLTEEHVAGALRDVAPFAKPNLRLVVLADRVLGRDGRMAAAINALPEAAMRASGVPFSMPAKLGAG